MVDYNHPPEQTAAEEGDLVMVAKRWDQLEMYVDLQHKHRMLAAAH